MIKVISLVYKKKGISSKQFLSYWLDKHGALVVENIPGVLHYTQNHPITSPGAPDDADGITEMWFEDMDAYNDYMEWRASDEANVMKESVAYMASMRTSMGDVGDVEDVMEDVKEAMEATNEMVEAISAPLGLGDPYDEEEQAALDADMDAELTAMAQKIDDEQDAKAEQELVEQLLGVHVPLGSSPMRASSSPSVQRPSYGVYGEAETVRTAVAMHATVPARSTMVNATPARSMLSELAD